MSRTSLLLGVVVAVAIHAALFWPFGARPPGQPKPVLPRLTLERPEEQPEQQAPETAAESPGSRAAERDEPEPVQLPDQPPDQPPDQRRGVSPPPAPMEETTEARRTELERAESGQSLVGTPDDDALPPVRIVWDGPEEVRSVARELGMRIVAVDRGGDVLGEVSRAGPPGIVPFEGSTGRFSNRVRMIDDRGFFGESIPRELDGRLSAFWLLVPAELDRALSAEIRRTIRESGFDSAEVRFVEASFEERAGRLCPPD